MVGHDGRETEERERLQRVSEVVPPEADALRATMVHGVSES
jgi:hypothetical protein